MVTNEMISAYVDDELTDEERAMVEEALAADEASRALRDDLLTARTELKSLSIPLGRDLSGDVLSRLAQETPPWDKPTPATDSVSKWPAVAAVVAATALLAAFASWMPPAPSDPDPPLAKLPERPTRSMSQEKPSTAIQSSPNNDALLLSGNGYSFADNPPAELIGLFDADQNDRISDFEAAVGMSKLQNDFASLEKSQREPLSVLDTSQNGAMEQGEALRGAAWLRSHSDVGRQAVDRFSHADANGDQQLTEEEIAQWLADSETGNETAARLFLSLNGDENGYLDKFECLAAAEEFLAQLTK